MKYLVKVWESEYDREEGISNIEGYNLSLETALELCKKTVDLGLAVVAEVLTENEEECIITYEGKGSNNTSSKLFIELCSDCMTKIPSNKSDILDGVVELIPIEVDIKGCTNHYQEFDVKNGILMYM